MSNRSSIRWFLILIILHNHLSLKLILKRSTGPFINTCCIMVLAARNDLVFSFHISCARDAQGENYHMGFSFELSWLVLIPLIARCKMKNIIFFGCHDSPPGNPKQVSAVLDKIDNKYLQVLDFRIVQIPFYSVRLLIWLWFLTVLSTRPRSVASQSFKGLLKSIIYFSNSSSS